MSILFCTLLACTPGTGPGDDAGANTDGGTQQDDAGAPADGGDEDDGGAPDGGDPGSLCVLDNSETIPDVGAIEEDTFCDELSVTVCQLGNAGAADPASYLENLVPGLVCELDPVCNGEDTMGATCDYQPDGGWDGTVDEGVLGEMCEVDALPAFELAITCIVFV